MLSAQLQAADGYGSSGGAAHHLRWRRWQQPARVTLTGGRAPGWPAADWSGHCRQTSTKWPGGGRTQRPGPVSWAQQPAWHLHRERQCRVSCWAVCAPHVPACALPAGDAPALQQALCPCMQDRPPQQPSLPRAWALMPLPAAACIPVWQDCMQHRRLSAHSCLPLQHAAAPLVADCHEMGLL